MKRAILWLVVALGLGACGGDSSRGGEPGGTVVIAELGGVGTLLPLVEQHQLDAEVNDLLYLGLSSGRWEDGELRFVADDLSLADRWEIGAESTTVTYSLRPRAVWSDGAPLTADDVVFSYELARDTLVGSTYSFLWANLDSVVARDPRTVSFFFKHPNPDLLFASGGLNIIPRHIYADADRARLRSHPRVVNPENGHLVVSGPFTVGSWDPGQQITLVPNPRAFTAAPAVARAVFRVIPEEATRMIEFASGNVHVTWPIPFERAPAIEAEPRLRIERVAARYYDFVAWNPATVPAFADRDVRRALSLAIDRRAILDAVGLGDYGTVAGGPYPPIFRDLRDPEVRPDPYAPDSARAILRRRGFADTNGDGILEKDGRPFRFTLTTNAGNARRASVLELLQAQLGRIGVDVRLGVLEPNTFWDAFFGRRYEAAVAGWSVSLSPDLTPFFYPGQSLNVTGYDNPRVTAWIDSAMVQPSAEAAARYWRRVARAVVEDRPYAWLYFYDGLVGVSERVHNTRINTYGVYQNLHEWRLEPASGAATSP